MTRELIEAGIYWDSQDPNNEGWAYRLFYDDEHQESGPFDWEEDGDLAEGVVELLHQNGISILVGEVANEPRIDGGYATWTRESE